MSQSLPSEKATNRQINLQNKLTNNVNQEMPQSQPSEKNTNKQINLQDINKQPKPGNTTITAQ